VPDLAFQIEGAEVATLSATPTVALKLRVTNADLSETIHAVALRCQIQIEVTQRKYSAEDQRKLRDLFDEPQRWSQTLRNLLWTHVSLNIPPFHDTTLVDIPVPCTFDFNVAATKYFHGLGDGEVPLCVMFSGSVFYSCDGGNMQVAPVSWDKEARYRLPVQAWQDMMDAHYPASAWLCLRRDTFERLYDYKVRNGIPTWEEALEAMLAAEEAVRR
jgi:Family of unknown function (DUF6084)